MQSFLVGEQNGAGQGVADVLRQDFGYATSVVPDLKSLRADRRFMAASNPLVLIDIRPADAGAMEATLDFAREMTGRVFTLCVADTIEPQDYKRLVRTGSADWIAWRGDRDELHELMARLEAPTTSERTAKILSFLPSKGGVGNTMLVVEVATHLAARRKRGGSRIAILDLNLQGGTVADALDIEPRFDVMEIVDRPERLDEHLVDIFTTHYSKTLDVFASPPRRIAPDALNPDIVFTFIDKIASRYDVILFDLPSQPMAWTDNLLRGSDAVIVSGGESLPALRRLTAALDHCERIGIAQDKLTAVVNAAETDMLGRVSRRALIERALTRRRAFTIRRDASRVAQALDVGRPLLEQAPNSGVARDVKRLADALQSSAAQPAGVRPSPMRPRGAVA